MTLIYQVRRATKMIPAKCGIASRITPSYTTSGHHNSHYFDASEFLPAENQSAGCPFPSTYAARRVIRLFCCFSQKRAANSIARYLRSFQFALYNRMIAGRTFMIRKHRPVVLLGDTRPPIFPPANNLRPRTDAINSRIQMPDAP